MAKELTEHAEIALLEIARQTVADHYHIPVQCVTGLGVLCQPGEDADETWPTRLAQFQTLCNLYNKMAEIGHPCGLQNWMIARVD